MKRLCRSLITKLFLLCAICAIYICNGSEDIFGMIFIRISCNLLTIINNLCAGLWTAVFSPPDIHRTCVKFQKEIYVSKSFTVNTQLWQGTSISNKVFIVLPLLEWSGFKISVSDLEAIFNAENLLSFHYNRP